MYGYGVLELGPPDTLPSSPNGTTTTTPTGGSTTTTTRATVVDRAHDLTSGVDDHDQPGLDDHRRAPRGRPRPPRPRPTTAAPPESQPSGNHGLGVSDAADRRDPRPLAGETLSGDSYVFVTPVWPSVTPDVVRFSVDGRLVQVERQVGFDLGGGTALFSYPFDTFRLGDGPHVLEARLQFGDGHEEVVARPVPGGQPGPALRTGRSS